MIIRISSMSCIIYQDFKEDKKESSFTPYPTCAKSTIPKKHLSMLTKF